MCVQGTGVCVHVGRGVCVHLGTGVCGYRGMCTRRYRGMCTRGYRDMWVQGYVYTWVQGYVYTCVHMGTLYSAALCCFQLSVCLLLVSLLSTQVSLKKFYEALSELQSYYSVSWGDCVCVCVWGGGVAMGWPLEGVVHFIPHFPSLDFV